jgi:hypothetical protein
VSDDDELAKLFAPPKPLAPEAPPQGQLFGGPPLRIRPQLPIWVVTFGWLLLHVVVFVAAAANHMVLVVVADSARLFTTSLMGITFLLAFEAVAWVLVGGVLSLTLRVFPPR